MFFYHSFDKIKLAGDIAYYKLYLLNLNQHNYEKAKLYLKIFYKYSKKYKFDEYYDHLTNLYDKTIVKLIDDRITVKYFHKFRYILNKITNKYFGVKYYLKNIKYYRSYYFLKEYPNDKRIISDFEYLNKIFLIMFVLKK